MKNFVRQSRKAETLPCAKKIQPPDALFFQRKKRYKSAQQMGKIAAHPAGKNPRVEKFPG
jgi:hypothetical protein